MTEKRPMTAGQMRTAAGVPEAYPASGYVVSSGIPSGSLPIALSFDPANETIFCARCGSRLEPLGHGFATFLLCPTHGEFTIAPVVIESTTGWQIRFRDEQAREMWDTCRAIDGMHLK